MSNESNNPANSINTGGGAYIGGAVTTGGGAFVGRDQTIIHSPGAAASHQGATLDEFRTLLNDIRALLPQTGLDERKARIIAADLAVVEDEAQQAQPDKSIIVSKLEGATQVAKAAGTLTEEGKKLLPMLTQILQSIAGLFP